MGWVLPWTEHLCFACQQIHMLNSNAQCDGISTSKSLILWDQVMDGISALIKAIQESSILFYHVRIQQEVGSLQPIREPSPDSQPHWHPDLGFPASRTVRNKSLLFTSTQSIIFCYRSLDRLRQVSSSMSVISHKLCCITEILLWSLRSSGCCKRPPKPPPPCYSLLSHVDSQLTF